MNKVTALSFTILIFLSSSCRKSFDIDQISSKLSVNIDQVSVFYNMNVIKIYPSVKNVYIPHVQKLGICWAINESPTIASAFSEKDISFTGDYNPNVIDDGFEIRFTNDTIYIVKAFVTFNDSLILYSDPRIIDLKDYN